MPSLAVHRAALGAALVFALACGGSSEPVAVPAPAVVVPPPPSLAETLADTKWTLSWTDRRVNDDRMRLNADGNVFDLGRDKVRGPWTLEGNHIEIVWGKLEYSGEVAEDAMLMKGSWKSNADGDTGTWKAVNDAKKTTSTSSSTSKSSGGGLPNCSEVTDTCKKNSDDRSRSCWSACNGVYACQDVCNETNRKERLDCERPSNCE